MHAQPGPNRTPMAVDSEDAAVISLRFEDGAIGAVVLFAREPGVKMGETEMKLALAAANFLGRQMEQ